MRCERNIVDVGARTPGATAAVLAFGVPDKVEHASSNRSRLVVVVAGAGGGVVAATVFVIGHVRICRGRPFQLNFITSMDFFIIMP